MFAASEPNLLKVRLKQRVIERRASPLARRYQRRVTALKNNTLTSEYPLTTTSTYLPLVVPAVVVVPIMPTLFYRWVGYIALTMVASLDNQW